MSRRRFACSPAYAKVGPRVIPTIVGGILAALGLALAWQAGAPSRLRRSTCRQPWMRRALCSTRQGPAGPRIGAPIIAIAVGLVQQMSVVQDLRALFRPHAVLFFCVTYGFGSRRYLRDAIIAVDLAIVTYVGFTHGLGLQLPAGILGGVSDRGSLGLADRRLCDIAVTLANLGWCLLGVTLGTAIGILPGIGPALTIALLLPVTAHLDPTGAFIMFAGLYYGAMYGSSTTSILLNTPGEIRLDHHGDRGQSDGAAGPRRRGAGDRRHRLVRRRHHRHGRC